MKTIILVAALSLTACAKPAAPAPTGSAAAAAETLPSDGAALFAFMLERHPKLVDKVPCSCCRYSIGECYRGACPAQCGPCNQIGRDVHAWEQQGMMDAEIVARVRTKYGMNR